MVEHSEHERRISLLEQTVERHGGILDGTFGQKGLRQTVTDFMAKWESREEDRKSYDDKNRFILNLIVALLTAVAGIALVGATIWLVERTTHSRILSDTNGAYTATKQDAGLK